MLFEKITKENVGIIEAHLKKSNSFSCEFTAANLLMWADMYATAFAVVDDTIYIRYSEKCGEFFTFSGETDTPQKIEAITEYCNENNIAPRISCNEDQIADAYQSIANRYDVFKSESSAEYIYLTEDLATLSGKKYHSKRNHIAAFDRKYDWVFEELSVENTEEILELSLSWANDNFKNDNTSITTDRDGLKMLLENFDKFSARGGIIRVEGKAVAFCLGTPINDEVFDINFEKALPEYQGAYAVINREFAKTLTDYKYINREDDLGIAGLRRAKLSYKPCRILNKYVCLPKSFKKQAIQLYRSTFTDETEETANKLFDKFFPENFYFKYVDNKIVSMLFVIEAYVGGWEAGYIYGAATDEKYRSRGFMRELLSIAAENNDILFLKPASETLYGYYSKAGYVPRFFNKKISGISDTLESGIRPIKITDSKLLRQIRETFLAENSAILSPKADELVCSFYYVFTDDIENPSFFAITDLIDQKVKLYELLYKKPYEEFLTAICSFYNTIEYEGYINSPEEKNGMLLCNREMSEILPEKLYLGYALD